MAQAILPSSQPLTIVIVRSDQLELYGELRQRLGGIARVFVDRRCGERRRGRAPMQAERRRTDRRQPVTAKADQQWRTAGYRVVYQPASVQMGAIERQTPAFCPECGLVLGFEMPLFREIPVQLDLDIVHTASPAGVRHVIDLEAVTTSGRRLLACRVRAGRYPWEARNNL